MSAVVRPRRRSRRSTTGAASTPCSRSCGHGRHGVRRVPVPRSGRRPLAHRVQRLERLGRRHRRRPDRRHRRPVRRSGRRRDERHGRVGDRRGEPGSPARTARRVARRRDRPSGSTRHRRRSRPGRRSPPTLTLTPVGSVVKTLREVKDDAEIARMSAAAAAADAALVDVEPLLFATIDEPVTEADIRNELEYRMRLHGADDRSYETIVAAGPDHGARPHHEPSAAHDRRGRHRDHRRRRARRRLPLRHDPFVRDRRADGAAARALRAGARPRSAPASPPSPARSDPVRRARIDRRGEPRRVRRGRIRRLVPARDRPRRRPARSTSGRSTRSCPTTRSGSATW